MKDHPLPKYPIGEFNAKFNFGEICDNNSRANCEECPHTRHWKQKDLRTVVYCYPAWLLSDASHDAASLIDKRFRCDLSYIEPLYLEDYMKAILSEEALLQVIAHRKRGACK